MIPYGRQSISAEDIQSVVDVLNSEWLTQGPQGPAFESEVADYCGAAHAVAVNSATSALHVACLALGLGPGDSLWTSPISFVASANCARYCGARVDFVDIDPQTYNLSVNALEQKLKEAERKGGLPRIVVPVHFAGQPCDMSRIAELAQRYGFRVLEDASHAIGAKYRGGAVGKCEFSDIAVFSFHPVKIITTGEGGMAMTNDPALAKKMRALRAHGITRDQNLLMIKDEGDWYYEMTELGFNYRMTEIQAALGSSQLKRLDEFLERRRELADAYETMLAEFPVVRPWRMPEGESAWHLYVIKIAGDGREPDRRRVFESLRERGIGVNVHYIPIHLQPYYQALGFQKGDYPEAEAFYSSALSLPLHPRLGEDDQRRVVSELQRAL